MKYPNTFLAIIKQLRLKQKKMHITYLLLSILFIAKPIHNLHPFELDKIETKPPQIVEGGIGGSGLILLPSSILKYS